MTPNTPVKPHHVPQAARHLLRTLASIIAAIQVT